MKVLLKTTSEKKIRAFVEGHYYSSENIDPTKGEVLLWQPFEDYPLNQIEEFIESDIYNLKLFLKIPIGER